MFLHRVGQRGAGFDVGARLEDDGREVLVFLLIPEDVQALHERQASVDHHGKLPREHRQVLGWRGFGPRLPRRGVGLGRRGCDLGDENLFAAQRVDDGVDGVADAFTVDDFSATCAPGKCKSSASLFYLWIGRAPAAPALASPAPATTPTPRLIMSCSSSRFDDAVIAVSIVISRLKYSDAID